MIYEDITVLWIKVYVAQWQQVDLLRATLGKERRYFAIERTGIMRFKVVKVIH